MLSLFEVVVYCFSLGFFKSRNGDKDLGVGNVFRKWF